MELGQAKLKVSNFVKLSCHIIPVCFYNNVYIHKNIYHFKIPQVIELYSDETLIWKYHGLVHATSKVFLYKIWAKNIV
jgi:hypothetical protein